MVKETLIDQEKTTNKIRVNNSKEITEDKVTEIMDKDKEIRKSRLNNKEIQINKKMNLIEAKNIKMKLKVKDRI